MITLATVTIGFALFLGQIHGSQLLAYWRKLGAEFERDFGTCDRVFPAFKRESDTVSPTFRKHLKPTRFVNIS